MSRDDDREPIGRKGKKVALHRPVKRYLIAVAVMTTRTMTIAMISVIPRTIMTITKKMMIMMMKTERTTWRVRK